MKTRNRTVSLLVACIFSASAQATELYLPLNLDTLAESNIEQLFVLADTPLVKRPYTVSKVEAAVDKVKDRHPALAKSIQTYLQRFKQNINVSHATLSLSTNDEANHTYANDRGESTNSNYHLRVNGFAKVNDSIILNVGGRYSSDANRDNNAILDGTFFSVAKYNVQLDLGYREHSFSPFQFGNMLASTNAPSLPSITVSNPDTYAFLGFSYELFWGQLSESDSILSEDGTQRLTGNPKLLGMHVGFAPLEGFAIGFNRLLQYGGADRDESISSLAQAFFNVKSNENAGAGKTDFGNQQSSINTSYTFSGATPLSLYMEYAGEDTSQTSGVHLGNTSIMLGAYFPKITEHLSLRYEFAEWQNAWYTNGNYGDGLTHDNLILGHWGANERVFSSAVGSNNHTAKLIYATQKHSLITTLKQVQNEQYSSIDYSPGQELSLDYSRAFSRYRFGMKLTSGTSVFDQNYSQFSGYVQW